MRRTLLVVVALLACGLAAAEEYFVPMVGQKQGQDGAWWNTEVWICNTSTITGGEALLRRPAGRPTLDPLKAEPPLEDLPAGATLYRNDLVPEGSIGVLRILTTQGVVVFTRVFNAAGRGSFGQGIPALPKSAAVKPGDIAQLVGLRRAPQFPTNSALFHPSTEHGILQVRGFLQGGGLAGG